MSAMNWFHAAQITKERLAQWQKRNEGDRIVCTPILLMNIGHGEKHSGEVVLNMVDDVKLEFVKAALLKAVDVVERQIREGN